MNPFAILPLRTWIIIGAVIAMISGGLWYRHHVFDMGVQQEKTRRDKIDADNDARARAKLADLNAKLAVAQAELSTAIANLATKEKEYNDERLEAQKLRDDLATGRQRLRVAVSARGACSAGQAPGSAFASVDSRAAVEAELEPQVASGLVGLTDEGDAAITRLNACIAAYDAVKAASDK